MLINDLNKFKVVTFKFYLPLHILTQMVYYVFNIPKLFNPLNTNLDLCHLGFFNFTVPFIEVGFFQLQIFIIFYWIKSCEKIQGGGTLEKLGLNLIMFLSKRTTIGNLLLLSLPVIEQMLAILYLFSGLNKLDMYHYSFIFIFLIYQTCPKFRRTLTYIVIIYGSLIIILKWIYTLVYSKTLD